MFLYDISSRESLNSGLMHDFQAVSEPLEIVCKVVDAIFFPPGERVHSFY